MKKTKQTDSDQPTEALARRPTNETLRVKKTWENFEESVGGRAALGEMLRYSQTREAATLLAHLEDPRAAGQPLRRLCEDAGLSFFQLYQTFKDAAKARAHIETEIVQANYLPRVMADTCEDALTTWRTCPACNGTGRLVLKGKRVDCSTCGGKGKVKEPGDIDNRKLALEAAGLVGRRGPLVAQQFNLNPGVPCIEDVVREDAEWLRQDEERERREREAADAQDDTPHKP